MRSAAHHFTGEEKVSIDLVQHTQTCLERALRDETRLPKRCLDVWGLSGKQGRALLNFLCEMPDVRYLEIGTCQGSTLISAAWNNKGVFQAIDNFSQYGGSFDHIMRLKEEFRDFINFDMFVGDCWNFDKTQLAGGYNVYFYDGPHARHDHEWATTKWVDMMADQFVFVVDDFNCLVGNVQGGTREGIAAAGLKILWEKEVNCEKRSDTEGWWNGAGVFVLSKS